MTNLSQRLITRYYKNQTHPYKTFENRVDDLIGRNTRSLLDAGCGRTAPVLRKYLGRVQRLIGVDLVDFEDVPPSIETYKAGLARLPIAGDCVDIIMSRSVFEHLSEPDKVYREFHRILKPGGAIVFLTANMWDYATLIARLVPNRLHARIVRWAEGRTEEDTFPTEYKTNTQSAIRRLAANSNLQVESIEYLSQYPNYFMFSGTLFFIAMCYEKLISRYEALEFLRGWIIVTLRKPDIKQISG